MPGHFDPQNFTLDDIREAVHETHDLPIPAPPLMSTATMAEALMQIEEANPERADDDEKFKSSVGWGIAIGVIAERKRLARNND